MTIREAKYELEQKENELELWINKKNIALNSVMPKAVTYDKEPTQGGLRQDKYRHLDNAIDEIDPIIDKLNLEIEGLSRYIEKGLQIMKEYEPLKEKIIKLREEYHLNWDRISEATHYSKSQCRRIYKKYLNKRYVEDEHIMDNLIM